MKNVWKKIGIISLVVILIAVGCFFVYDLVFFAPKVTISFKEHITQKKLDTNFKVKTEVTSLSYVKRTFVVGLDLVNTDSKKSTSLPTKQMLLGPRKPVTTEFSCIITDPLTAGNYVAVAYVEGQTSLLSRELKRIEESRENFVIAEKIVNGVVNLIDIRGVKKVGETITINGVIKNTGEVAKPFTVSGKITNPQGESFTLPDKDFNLNIEGSRTFSYDYSIPIDAVAGKYRVALTLYAGESNDPNKRKVADLEEEVLIAERVIKASVERISLKGKLKSGETVGFDIEVKNTGDINRLFSIDVTLVDPAGKNIPFPSKDIQLAVDEVKKISYNYPIPMTGSHGRYKISVVANVGASNDLTKRKVTEFHQEFTVAERVTKASVATVKVTSKGKIKVSEVITVMLIVKNTGELPHSFPVSVTVNNMKEVINLTPKKLQLEIGEAKDISFDYQIPLEAPFGTYEIKVSVWNDINQNGQLVEQYEEKIQKIEVGGPTIEAKASLIGTIAPKKYGETALLKVKYTNTGEAKHEYFIKLEIIDPTKKVNTIINEKLELDKGESKEKDGVFNIDVSLPDGKYQLVASIWDKLGEDGLPAGKYSEDIQIFDVIDTPPVIVRFIGVPPVVGQEGVVTVIVKDDKEISFAKLVYKGPNMTEEAKELMTKVKGSKREAEYTAKTMRFKYSGTLIYYVEITDSKGQKTKSEKSQSNIK